MGTALILRLKTNSVNADSNLTPPRYFAANAQEKILR